ncbi:MAG: hypothetical protein AAB601_01385 [Patescibacteria group bacterium]
MKPITKIILVVLILLMGAAAIYLIWGRLAPKPLVPEEETTPGGTLPIVPALPGERAPEETEATLPGEPGGPAESGAARVKRVSDFPVFDAWVNRENGEVLYLTPEGRAYVVQGGPDAQVSSQPILALNAVTPAPDGSRALVTFGNPRSRSWGIFDSVDKAWRPLPGTVLSAGWAGRSDQLFALVATGTLVSLVRVDLSKSTPATQTILSDLRMREVLLMSRTPEEVLILDRPSALVKGRLWRYEVRSGSLNLLLAPAAGLSVALSDDAKLLFRWSSPDQFSILNETLGETMPLFFSTFPSKCGGNATTTYCFVPLEIEGSSLLPDEYLIGTLGTTDRLYRISIPAEDAYAVPLQRGSPALDAARVVVLDDRLYVVNRADRALYEIALPEASVEQRP